MISTVTTTTVTTVTTGSLAASLGLVAVLTLVVLLVQKELVTANAGPRANTFGQALNVAILPLLMAFALIAIANVAAILR
jgi:uncharacterized membrane protein